MATDAAKLERMTIASNWWKANVYNPKSNSLRDTDFLTYLKYEYKGGTSVFNYIQTGSTQGLPPTLVSLVPVQQTPAATTPAAKPPAPYVGNPNARIAGTKILGVYHDPPSEVYDSGAAMAALAPGSGAADATIQKLRASDWYKSVFAGIRDGQTESDYLRDYDRFIQAEKQYKGYDPSLNETQMEADWQGLLANPTANVDSFIQDLGTGVQVETHRATDNQAFQFVGNAPLTEDQRKQLYSQQGPQAGWLQGLLTKAQNEYQAFFGTNNLASAVGNILGTPTGESRPTTQQGNAQAPDQGA